MSFSIQTGKRALPYNNIDDLQSIPEDSKDSDMAVMLVPHAMEVNEILLRKFHQHGRHDVTCKSRIHLMSGPEGKQNLLLPEGQDIKCFVIWRQEKKKTS